MNSITKTRISEIKLREITKQAFGNSALIEEIKELTDGFFNSAYLLKLSNGFKTVLKVSPQKAIRVMRYEHNIMETEVKVLNKIAALETVPVPKILYYDRSLSAIDSEFYFMEFIEGIPLNKHRDQITQEQYDKISTDAGAYFNQIKELETGYFGYISQPDKRFDTWGKAFSFMIKELIDDAREIGAELPCSYQYILDIVNSKIDVLDMVKTPSLLHKDLWEGNIFVNQKTAEITGFIDFERAICGDSLLEPVCGFLLDNPKFMLNYYGKASLDKEEKTRTILYKIYLFLLMVIECPFRQYPGEDCDKWQREQLKLALEEISKPI